MPTAPIDVSIVLVSWNTRELLLGCLAALPAAVGGLCADVWVVDNGSTDGSVEAVRSGHPDAHIIQNERNVGFAAANNQAIVASAGRYVLLLNSDTIALPGSIERLVRFADARPAMGVVGAMLLNPDGSFQASFADFPSLHSELLSATGLGARLFGHWYPNYGPRRSQRARRVDYIQGACMLARRAAIEQAGLLDEQYFMYSEETDWCLNM
ncbi:MAG TPA: glycosyltransferase family 2 protein, partial [Roseiflexaceae bacterium]